MQIMQIKNKGFFMYALAIIIFIILTFIMTYPLFLRINTSISGFFSTDEPSVWYFWWLKYAHTNNIDHRNCQYLAYPFGQDYGTFDLLYPLWSAFKRITATTMTPCLAYNIEIIASFILSGLFFYLLMMFLSENAFISVFSGLIYAFSPYHFARAWQHIGLSHIQWMPLCIYAMLQLHRKRDWKCALLFLAALFAVGSFDYYYLYFMVVVTFIFVFYFLFGGVKRNWRALFYITLAIILDLLVMLMILWPFIKTRVLSLDAKAASAWGVYRSFEDLFAQSARPLSYLLPSTEHPLLGWISKSFIGTDLYGMSFTEHALYLGWVPLILAFVAIKKWRSQRQTVRDDYGSGKAGETFYIGFFVLLGFVSWLFSQPPWWNVFGLKIYMPSFFMYKILPMFRAYCRFGIVVMLAVAVLAGFGLKSILSRFKNETQKIAITGLFCGLVLFEFWNYPPFKVIDLSRAPAVYYWLKNQTGDFVIAEYPLDTDGPDEMYKFYQTRHEKKIINGTIPGSYANNLARTITKLSDPHTASVLKWMGVKYAIVHRDNYLKTGLIEDEEDLNNIPKNSGLRFIRTFPAQGCPQENIFCVQKTGPIDVYEVEAGPVKPSF